MCLHLQLILSGCLKFGRFLLFLSSYICNSHFSSFYFCLVIVLSPASSMKYERARSSFNFTECHVGNKWPIGNYAYSHLLCLPSFSLNEFSAT